VVSDAQRQRVQRFGPEHWAQQAGQDWSLWDLWFCVIAVADHDGDLDALARSFVDRLRGQGLNQRDANEAKLSHLTDLGARLAAAGLTAEDLADPEVLADQTIRRRARDKVLGRITLEHRARTRPMLDTPRQRLGERARHGHWPACPTDPSRFFERFRPTVERRGFVTGRQSFAIAARLEKRLADLDGPRRSLPDRLALYRAFHTAGLELADAADDSYGAIGETRQTAWLTYLGIDWRSTSIAPRVYWQDLCELRIWEPYAVDHQHRQAWFASARADDLGLVEGILEGLEQEHRRAVLDWEADEALQALADLYLATRASDRYVPLARRLGSRWWQPIEAMAAAQLTANDPTGAIAIFQAADQPGPHRDHLRRRCHALTGIDPTA
jgi:hypothetical protein